MPLALLLDMSFILPLDIQLSMSFAKILVMILCHLLYHQICHSFPIRYSIDMSLAMSFATILVMVLCHFDMSQGIALAVLLAMLFAMPLTLSLT